MPEATQPINAGPLPLIIPHDHNFADYNRGVHPNVPPRLSAPAINWHQAFWNHRPKDTLICGSNNSPIDDLMEIIVSILNNEKTEITNINGFTGNEINRSELKFLKNRISFVNSKWSSNIRRDVTIDVNDNSNPFRLGDI